MKKLHGGGESCVLTEQLTSRDRENKVIIKYVNSLFVNWWSDLQESSGKAEEFMWSVVLFILFHIA